MKRQLGIVLTVVGFASWLCLSNLAAPQDQPESHSKLQELLTQRRDVLNSRLSLFRLRFEQNIIGSVAAYAGAHNQLAMAELELATDKRHRLSILRKLIVDLRSLENLLAAKINAGAGGTGLTLDRQLVTAHRLQAEIDFVREE